MSGMKLESTAKVNIGGDKGLFMLSGRRSSERMTLAANSNQGQKHKRRHTSFSVGDGFKRRKKDGGIIPPTKFLLGGNINDPLNLNSLSDDVNQVTPKTSPLPTPRHRIQVQVLIPPNINDPLNLNADDDAELQLMSPKTQKRKHRKKKKAPTCPQPAPEDAPEETPAPTLTSISSVPIEPPCTPPRTLKLEPPTQTPESGATDDQGKLLGTRGRRSDDKIVSPVVPQPGMIRKRGLSGSEPQSKVHGKKGKVTVTAVPVAKPRFREKDSKYRYGNYDRYYGYRNPSTDTDVRLQCFRREWFEGMDVLDIGCNVGHLTLTVASEMAPRKIIGMDIDAKLIQVAKKNVRHYLRDSAMEVTRNDFPISFAICHGPIVAPGTEMITEAREGSNFPNNVFFAEGNYVLECDELLEMQKPSFDTILCLSLTKWVHLNWGDAGLKRLFKRMYRQLRPGGRMILEAQAFSSYTRKKKLTETIFDNYQNIRLRPERFTEYLLSQEVGFTKCEVVDVPMNPSRGFRRPIQLFTKGMASSQSPFQDRDVLPKQVEGNRQKDVVELKKASKEEDSDVRVKCKKDSKDAREKRKRKTSEESLKSPEGKSCKRKKEPEGTSKSLEVRRRKISEQKGPKTDERSSLQKRKRDSGSKES